MEKGQGKKQEKKQEKKREAKIRAGVKLTVHGRERFFGPGICELLEQIGQTGSIQAAAARMEMSYTKAWKILNRAEEEMGMELIVRVNDGKRGGSCTLTPAGERAIRDYRSMETELQTAAEKLMEQYAASFGDGQAE